MRVIDVPIKLITSKSVHIKFVAYTGIAHHVDGQAMVYLFCLVLPGLPCDRLVKVKSGSKLL